MSLLRDICYCIDCQEVVTPAVMQVCPCNNKFMIIQQVNFETAIKIETYREKGFKSVKIIEGELVPGNGPTDQVVKSVTRDNNDTGEVEVH